MSSEPQGTIITIPKMIEPISTVPPRKFKRKTPIKSAYKKKKNLKYKKSESKSVLSMAELYEEENPFISTVMEPSVETSEKDTKSVNVETVFKIVAEVVASEIEKGNPIVT